MVETCGQSRDKSGIAALSYRNIIGGLFSVPCLFQEHNNVSWCYKNSGFIFADHRAIKTIIVVSSHRTIIAPYLLSASPLSPFFLLLQKHTSKVTVSIARQKPTSWYYRIAVLSKGFVLFSVSISSVGNYPLLRFMQSNGNNRATKVLSQYCRI